MRHWWPWRPKSCRSWPLSQLLWQLGALFQPMSLLLLMLAATSPTLSAGLRLARGVGRPSTVPGVEFAEPSVKVEAAVPRNATVSTIEALALARRKANASTSNCASERSTWSGPDVSSPMRVEALRQWMNIATPAGSNALDVSGRPVIKPAFLMMIYHRIVFAKSWEVFFRQGGNRTSTLLIHSKLPTEVPEFFKPYLMAEDVMTSRCHNSRLMLRMMRLALGDRDVSHLAVISGDTLPLQPLSFIVRDLASRPSSRFCVDAEWLRAETWLVLERSHAALFTENSAAHKNLIPYTDCEDEDLFYWPLAVRRESLLDQCMMMTDWSQTLKYWSKDTERCACPSFLASDKNPGHCASPSVFKNVSEKGLDELIGSPEGYWYARKFLGDGLEGSTYYRNAKGYIMTLDDEVAGRLLEATGR